MTDEELHAYEKRNAFMANNNITIVEAGLSGSTMKAEITENSLNPYGYIHGGLIFTLVDCVCGLTARQDGRRYVTQSANIEFLSNVTEGVIYGRSSVIRRGKKMTIVHAEVRSEDGTLLADAVVDMYCTE